MRKSGIMCIKGIYNQVLIGTLDWSALIDTWSTSPSTLNWHPERYFVDSLNLHSIVISIDTRLTLGRQSAIDSYASIKWKLRVNQVHCIFWVLIEGPSQGFIDTQPWMHLVHMIPKVLYCTGCGHKFCTVLCIYLHINYVINIASCFVALI